LSLLDTAERRFDLEAHRGDVVVLNLWASWCPPCRAEIPRLNRLERELSARGLVVLGVNAEELPLAGLGETAQKLGIAYPVALPLSPLTGALRPNGTMPQTWLIDRRGRVRASVVGLVSERALRSACERLLREDGSQSP
jgi:thiol-disulfide isomerase/thioredoxin